MQLIDSDLNERIRDECGLINLAKEIFTETVVESCRSIFGDEKDEEFYDNVRNNIPKYTSFFVKVRHNEVWNEEMAKAAKEKLIY